MQGVDVVQDLLARRLLPFTKGRPDVKTIKTLRLMENERERERERGGGEVINVFSYIRNKHNNILLDTFSEYCFDNNLQRRLSDTGR